MFSIQKETCIILYLTWHPQLFLSAMQDSKAAVQLQLFSNVMFLKVTFLFFLIVRYSGEGGECKTIWSAYRFVVFKPGSLWLVKCLCGTTSIRLVTQSLFSSFQRTFSMVTSLNSERGPRFVKSFYPLSPWGTLLLVSQPNISQQREDLYFLGHFLKWEYFLKLMQINNLIQHKCYVLCG